MVIILRDLTVRGFNISAAIMEADRNLARQLFRGVTVRQAADEFTKMLDVPHDWWSIS